MRLILVLFLMSQNVLAMSTDARYFKPMMPEGKTCGGRFRPTPRSRMTEINLLGIGTNPNRSKKLSAFFTNVSASMNGARATAQRMILATAIENILADPLNYDQDGKAINMIYQRSYANVLSPPSLVSGRKAGDQVLASLDAATMSQPASLSPVFEDIKYLGALARHNRQTAVDVYLFLDGEAFLLSADAIRAMQVLAASVELHTHFIYFGDVLGPALNEVVRAAPGQSVFTQLK